MSDAPQNIGAYAIDSEIGRGGMGVVYKATDSRLGRTVAIKALPEHFAADPDRLARFEREARTLASLNHPNVAGIYGVEEHDGRRYLVLEYVEGESLADRLDRGPLPLDDALEICAEVAAGVEAAHEAGVIHRDLKPANIKITPEGKAKVLDFGLARTEEISQSGSSVSQMPTLTTPLSPHTPTMPGAVLGTAPYMSPEQARGRKVDKRSDIWSLGVVLYECLTGSSPFVGETATDSIGAILHKDVDYERLPTETPQRVRDLLARMLQRDKTHRMRDAGDVWLELEAARHGVSDGAIHSGGRGRRSPVFWVAFAAAAVAAFVGAWVIRGAPSVAPAPSGGPQFTRVTDQGGVEIHASLSPNGQTLLYTAVGPEGYDIFSQRVGGFNALNLTADYSGNDLHPAFSPDGARIAFASERSGGGIWVMGATGESPRRLTQFGYWPEWSPDGETIVFTTENVVTPFARTTVASLWTVRASGGEPVRIYDGDAVNPSWSPNGQRIAFWALTDGGNRNVLTIPAGGGEPIPVTTGSTTDWSPAWSPDGRRLYFCSDRSGAMNLWRVAINEESGEAISPPEPVTSGTGDGMFFMRAARDTGRLAFSSIAMSMNVERIALDLESNAAVSQPEAVTTGSSAILWPNASADGSKIAATILREHEDIVVLNADGTSRRLLTNDVAKDRLPSWSADGRWISFSSDRSGSYEVWIIRPDGSDLRQVSSFNGRMASGSFLPGSGSRLALSIDNLEILNIDEQGEIIDRQVLEIPEVQDTLLQPDSLSRDGSLVASSRLSGPDGLSTFVVNLATGETIATINGYATYTWIDNTHLAMATQSRIDIFDIASGEATTLLDTGVDDVSSGLSFDAANGYLYYSRGVTEADIWVADLPNE